MKEYITYIDENGIDGELVTRLIEEHAPERARMIELYERYKASIQGVPILTRKPVEYEDFETGAIKRLDNKVNHALNNSFDAEIVDTKVGYMFGHPIAYHADDNDPLEKTVMEFLTRNTAEDADAELGKKAAICGKGARLLYVDKEGNERLRNIDPWEVIFLYESDITEPTYAIRYYPVNTLEAGVEKEVWQAEFYDGTKVAYFHAGEQRAKYQFVKEEEDLFDFCPLFGVPNNEEMQGDAEKVLNLIDAYDRALSDANNEIEQYRLAYLVLKGVGMDEETLDEVKRSGVFQLLDDKEDLSYLTKDVNNTMIEDHLDRLEQNILRFAKSVNFGDEQFSGNSSGIAIKFKLMALENKCVVMERKFTSALRYQFKALCSAWAKRGRCQPDDYLEIWMQYKRNLPANILEEAQASLQLKGIVSEATRLGMLSFVDDVEHELRHIEEDRERLPSVDLDAIDTEQ